MTFYSAVGYFVTRVTVNPGNFTYVSLGYWGITNFFEVWLTYLWAPFVGILAYRQWIAGAVPPAVDGNEDVRKVDPAPKQTKPQESRARGYASLKMIERLELASALILVAAGVSYVPQLGRLLTPYLFLAAVPFAAATLVLMLWRRHLVGRTLEQSAEPAVPPAASLPEPAPVSLQAVPEPPKAVEGEPEAASDPSFQLARFALLWFVLTYFPYIGLYFYGRVTYPYYILPAIPAISLGCAYLLTRKWFPREVGLRPPGRGLPLVLPLLPRQVLPPDVAQDVPRPLNDVHGAHKEHSR